MTFYETLVRVPVTVRQTMSLERAASGGVRGTLIDWPELARTLEQCGVQFDSAAHVNGAMARELSKLCLALNQAKHGAVTPSLPHDASESPRDL